MNHLKTYNESLRDKMTSKDLSGLTDKYIKYINHLLESGDLTPLEDMVTKKNETELIDVVNILGSKWDDLYYINTKNKEYYYVSELIKNLLTFNAFLYDKSHDYDYHIYKEQKVIYCRHDRYFDKITDIFIIDIPFLKKEIQSW